MKAHILTYDDRFAPGCCDGENGMIVPLTIFPDRDDPSLECVVGCAKLSTTADGVDAEIAVNSGILGDAVLKMLNDGETYALDPFILKTEGILHGACTKCKIFEVSIISKEEIKDESV